MSDSVALVIVDEIARAYDFGPSHPLRPERVLLTYEHCKDLGLTGRDHVTEIEARTASTSEIERCHDPEFVAAVKAIDAGEAGELSGREFGLGFGDNPIFASMHKASTAVSGASLTAMEAVIGGDYQHSFNPAGGLHHARRREASGFCIYNDPAVAIAAALDKHPDWRVMYVDVDVHHGDGVQWIFYDEPRVLTVSLHESGRYLYPGTGFENETGGPGAPNSSINVPFEPMTGDADYLRALEEVVPAAAERFAPDLLVTQLGGDTHHGDPLANLGLTMRAYPPMAALLHEVAHAYASGRWVATGGGGYQATTVVPRIWTIHFAEMCAEPEVIPQEWIEDVDPALVSRPMPGR